MHRKHILSQHNSSGNTVSGNFRNHAYPTCYLNDNPRYKKMYFLSITKFASEGIGETTNKNITQNKQGNFYFQQ